jgi:deoxyribodipyrimidine photolyase-related protein
MKYYYDYLKSNGFDVKYISFMDIFNIKEYTIFDPIDRISLLFNYKIIESPNFLMNIELYKQYRSKTNKFFFNSFYMWSKNKLDILPSIQSQDKYNRNKLPYDIKIPKIIKLSNIKYTSIGIEYVDKYFNNNYGNTNNFNYPLTHSDAKLCFKYFVKTKLKNFGTYQDAISSEHNVLFHSMISSSLNIGLLQPNDIVKCLLKYKNKIPLNSLEAFIRQLFWREYQRYCYIYCEFENKLYFDNKKRITNEWYYGSTGMLPVDNCIIKAFDTGYLHHIERLMIIGNYMNLSEIKPIDGFKWFMEFSCDSYLWVMYQNVYDMVFFVTGGQTMRRPYISSSNYIFKMSDYNKITWYNYDKWNDLYHMFIKKNKEKLKKFGYYIKT